MLVITLTNAVIEPHTMMVKSGDTSVTYTTVFAAWRPVVIVIITNPYRWMWHVSHSRFLRGYSTSSGSYTSNLLTLFVLRVPSVIRHRDVRHIPGSTIDVDKNDAVVTINVEMMMNLVCHAIINTY